MRKFNIVKKIRLLLTGLPVDCRGDFNPLGVIIGLAIVVILGALMLSLFQTSINELWTGLINRVKTLFQL